MHSPSSCGPGARGRTRLSFVLHPGLHVESLIFPKLNKLEPQLQTPPFPGIVVGRRGAYFFFLKAFFESSNPEKLANKVRNGETIP